MRKAERLFNLVNLIRSYQPVTAQTLADELSVSVRSIYRYIDDLSVNGIPVYGEAGVGYRLSEHFELPPLNLTEAEFKALLLGVEMVSMATGRQMPQAAKSLRNKLAAAMPEASRLMQEQTARALDIGGQSLRENLWDQLSEAITGRRKIAFDYVSLSDAHSQRIVHPLGLFYWGGKWTLASWCCLREGFREFRIDRISNLRLLAELFAALPEQGLSAYLEHQSRMSSVKKPTDTRVSGGGV